MTDIGTEIMVVSVEQVEAAQALIRISGGPDKVRPLIRRIAEAPPATPEDRAAYARQQAAARPVD